MPLTGWRKPKQARGQPREAYGDGGLGAGVRREQGVPPGEQEAVLPVPPAATLSPIFRRLDGFRGYAAWLPLPPSVLVDPGGAQERRQK